MVWYRSKQGTTQNASLHCLHKYRLSFRCSCLWQTMQRRVGLSFVSVGGISIKKCPSVRRKGFPSKLVLPPSAFNWWFYYGSLLHDNLFDQFRAEIQCVQFASFLFMHDVSTEWRYVYKMHEMFLVPLLYSFALSLS